MALEWSVTLMLLVQRLLNTMPYDSCFIRNTVCLHCDSMYYESQFIEVKWKDVATTHIYVTLWRSCRTGFRNICCDQLRPPTYLTIWVGDLLHCFRYTTDSFFVLARKRKCHRKVLWKLQYLFFFYTSHFILSYAIYFTYF